MSTSATRHPAADAVARRTPRAHDENFPIAFAVLPRWQRAGMHAVYAFCRATDDLGDKAPGGPQERLELLDAWERDTRRAFGGAPRDPRLRALAVAVERHDLPLDPFLRLIEANRMDQRRRDWERYDELLDYCRHSATPVGEMVLAVFGYRDPWRLRMSDATCTGLQLVNFWQDVARDRVERGRVYLPREDMRHFGVKDVDLRHPPAGLAVRELIAFQVARARAQLEAGAPLAHFVRRREGLYLRMFTAGGLALCDAIAARGYDTLSGRPAPGRRGRARIALCVVRDLLGRRPPA